MIIDAHVHICPPQVRQERQSFLDGEPEFSGIYSDPRAELVGATDLVTTMDEQGVDRAVVFGFPWRKEANFRLNNDYVLEAAKRYPDRLIPFCCLHPGHPDTEAEIRRCFDGGALGVGELAYYSRGLDETARNEVGRAAAVCEEADRFLLLHTNEPVGHNYPGKSPMHLGQVYALLQERPHTRWILAHAGGGLPFYALMKKEVEDVLAGCLFDIAALPFLFKPEGLRALARAAGPEKFILGTDFPLLPPRRYYKLLEASGLSQEERDMILGGNMERELS
ncbi:MAG: amidohydrolase [Desulfohalobiaceae bacterium]|nr:amidohydrolase [Desulfohalobiaceae bacterium]